MGKSLMVVGVLTLGALLTSLFEPLLYRLGGQERGSATAVRPRPDVHLSQPDRWLYPAGPLIAFLGVTLATLVLPLDAGLIGSDLGIGVFYFIVVVDFVVLGIAVGGWGANTANAVEACYRIVAQLIAYVIPLGLALMGPIMMARSLSTTHIVMAQSGLWFIVLQPLGFVLYVVTGLMQTYRPPFLEPFASDIHQGILEVYGGWKALIWRLALSGVFFVVAAMGAVLFLGGWRGPWVPGPVWMLLKTYALMAAMVWLGTRVRPLSTAQMLALSWKILIPLGLVNVLVVGAMILLKVGPT